MKTIFGLVENYRILRLGNFVGYLQAAIGRQAVHNFNILRGKSKQARIYLKVFEIGDTFLLFVFLTHTRPGIGVNHIGAGDSFGRRVRCRYIFGVKFVARRTGCEEIHSEFGTNKSKRAGDIIAVTDIDYFPARQPAAMLLYG